MINLFRSNRTRRLFSFLFLAAWFFVLSNNEASGSYSSIPWPPAPRGLDVEGSSGDWSLEPFLSGWATYRTTNLFARRMTMAAAPFDLTIDSPEIGVASVFDASDGAYDVRTVDSANTNTIIVGCSEKFLGLGIRQASQIRFGLIYRSSNILQA